MNKGNKKTNNVIDVLTGGSSSLVSESAKKPVILDSTVRDTVRIFQMIDVVCGDDVEKMR